ncbi:hypothetical protein CsSME_00051040 [Camellia sinensis var. sinensis]
MVGRDIEKMIAVGLVWGATNALMRRGTLIWDQTLKNSPPPNTTHNRFLSTLQKWLNLLLIWHDTPISLAVPVTNATTFAATAVFGMLLGEETRVGSALFGTFLINYPIGLLKELEKIQEMLNLMWGWLCFIKECAGSEFLKLVGINQLRIRVYKMRQLQVEP